MNNPDAGPAFPFLEVSVTFPVINPPSDASVSIKFPEIEQAKWYHDHILSRPFHQAQNLQSRRRENTVTIRLPSRFSRIVASTRFDGFYFGVRDRRLAEDWAANLLIWRVFPPDPQAPHHTPLCVIRNWSQDPAVKALLLSCLPKQKQIELQAQVAFYQAFYPEGPSAFPPPPPPLPPPLLPFPPRELGPALGSMQGVLPKPGTRELGPAVGSAGPMPVQLNRDGVGGAGNEQFPRVPAGYRLENYRYF